MKCTKQILATVAAVALILSMSACDNGTSTTPSASGNKTVPAQSQKVDQVDTQKNSETQKQEAEPKTEFHPKLTEVYRIGARKIYMNVPNWQKINNGYTNLFKIHGQKYIAVTAAKDDTPSSLTEAHEQAIAEFKLSMSNEQIEKLNVEKDETLTINGMEVYRYEGTLTRVNGFRTDQTYEVYAVGYSFIADGIPCNIMGSLDAGINDDQPQEVKDEIRELVDAMIQTVRSEK